MFTLHIGFCVVDETDMDCTQTSYDWTFKTVVHQRRLRRNCGIIQFPDTFYRLHLCGPVCLKTADAVEYGRPPQGVSVARSLCDV